MKSIYTIIIMSAFSSLSVMSIASDVENQDDGFDVAAIVTEHVDGVLNSDEPLWTVKVAYSPWFVNWSQTSTTASRFGSDAINVDYSIDGAVAQSARIEATFWKLGTDLNLVQLPEGSAGSQQALSSLSAGINYADLIGETTIAYRYEQGSFQGFISGEDNSGNTSTGTFETDMTSHDISLISRWGVGIGYRTFSYEVPQDIYLINTSTNDVLIAGFADMHYDANFFTLIFTREELLNPDFSNFNLGLELRYGLGTMTPSGDFIDETKAALRDEDVDDDIIADADANFTEVDFYAYMPLIKNESISSEIRLGYRTDTLTAEFGEGNGEYALLTDFETEISGAYLQVSATF
jgi:hypothetical protein